MWNMTSIPAQNLIFHKVVALFIYNRKKSQKLQNTIQCHDSSSSLIPNCWHHLKNGSMFIARKLLCHLEAMQTPYFLPSQLMWPGFYLFFCSFTRCTSWFQASLLFSMAHLKFTGETYDRSKCILIGCSLEKSTYCCSKYTWITIVKTFFTLQKTIFNRANLKEHYE